MRLKNIALGLFVVAVCYLVGWAAWLYKYATTPTGSADTAVVVWIKPGQGFFETMDCLEKAGVIKEPDKFRWLAYLRGLERKIKAGEYLLRPSMPPGAILGVLVRGETLVQPGVVPEGLALRKVGEVFEKIGLFSADTFVKTASDPKLVNSLGLEGETLEGYLFPETYYFSKGVTAESVARKMVAQFRSVVTADWTRRAKDMGLTLHQLVTLASIIEKETARADERSMVAAVFLSRLKLGMRLESDPTVIYGIKDFSGNITRQDLESYTPYNTYKIQGLPIGPICSPGKAALEAVLTPAAGDFLYFVSKNDGSHHFSRTLAEHNKMVDYYQRGILSDRS